MKNIFTFEITEKIKTIFAIVVVSAVALVFAIPLGIARSKQYSNVAWAQTYQATSKVGYHAQYLGNVKRSIPKTTQDGGLETGYPIYGRGMKLTTEQRQAIIDESNSLTAVGTRIDASFSTRDTYDCMDASGNLYLNGTATGNKLYKHTASVGLYLGDVSDKEPGVIKKIRYKNRGAGYNITGLYAPAGEVVQIKISKEDLQKTNGLVVYIGQALYNGQANNIWASKGVMNRMPVLLNQLTLTASTTTAKVDKNGNYTFYVGSFLGGAIYVRPYSNGTQDFSVTISGGVNYSHFILGYTTESEFKKVSKSTAPVFDLMVWDSGVLHSGPKVYAQNFSYKDLYDAAVLWEKISAVSTAVKGTACGIVFLYDPFVAAGAAVAFPGRNSVNCPTGWMANSLNYKTFVTSGAWGNIHEYNHNFQGYGLPGGGEVTNNAISLVEYALFTKVSSARKIGSSNEGQGGWNRYTSASWSIMQGNNFGRENQLSIYSSLLHCFGPDNFIKSAHAGGTDNYFKLWSNTTKHNMTYFANAVGYPVSESVAEEMAANNYPMFVPVGSIYQTGRSFMYEGKKQYIETMQPYMITYGKDFTLDLRKYQFDGAGMYEKGSIAIPNGFSVTVKKITQPKYGTIKRTDEVGVYTFTPSTKSMRSGKFYVTLGITKDDGAFLVDDVDLVIEFEQTHEFNKHTLTRTTYTYTDETKYTDATDAFNAKYAGYKSVVKEDNQNPYLNGKLVQNCNTDIWYIDAQPDTKVVELSGKLHVDEAAKYRISLRGRWNCALYLSTDNGKTYKLAATSTGQAGSGFSSDASTYKDMQLESNSWVYFKAVMVTGSRGNISSFMGLGFGKFTPPSPIFGGENGDEIIGETEESVRVSYATGYRASYEIQNNKFESDYFYKKSYTANYNKEYGYMPNASIVSINTECAAPNGETTYNIENILDKNEDNAFHSKYLASQQPVEVVVDLGEEITANRFTIQGYRVGSTNHVPNSFTIYTGTTLENLQETFSVTNGAISGGTISANFNVDPEKSFKTFRYYKLVITGTNMNRYIAFKWIKFYHNVSGGKVYSPDDDMFNFKGKWSKTNAFSTFGHIYTGKDASVEFTFTGKQFGIFSYMSKDYKNFEVVIDGKVVATADISKNLKSSDWAYLSPKLKDGKHKVVIRSKKAFNVDSIVLW